MNSEFKDEEQKANKPQPKAAQKRLGKRSQSGSYLVDDGGIVLYVPFISLFFHLIGLQKDEVFIDENARASAVLQLRKLVTGKTEKEDERLVLAKLLCGWPLNKVVPQVEEPATAEKHRNDLLEMVPKSFNPFLPVSVEELQEHFVQREARLSRIGNKWVLVIKRKPYDFALKQFIFPFQKTKTPWLHGTIHVKW